MAARSESAVATTHEDRHDLLSSGSKFLLGFAAISPGLIFLGYQELDYILVPYVCAGTRSWVLFHVLAVATLVLMLVAGLVGWRYWRRGGAAWETEAGSVPASARFLGILGLGSAAFFALVVLGMWAAHFILHPCQ